MLWDTGPPISNTCKNQGIIEVFMWTLVYSTLIVCEALEQVRTSTQGTLASVLDDQKPTGPQYMSCCLPLQKGSSHPLNWPHYSVIANVCNCIANECPAHSRRCRWLCCQSTYDISVLWGALGCSQAASHFDLCKLVAYFTAMCCKLQTLYEAILTHTSL